MQIFQTTIADFFERVDLPIAKHMDPIFADFEKSETIKTAVGGPICVIENYDDLKKMRLTSFNGIGKSKVVEDDKFRFEYAEWTFYREYLFIVDEISNIGAPSFFLKNIPEVVSPRILEIFQPSESYQKSPEITNDKSDS